MKPTDFDQVEAALADASLAGGLSKGYYQAASAALKRIQRASSKEALADLLIERLNEILEVDRPAVSALMLGRVDCNDALADHPTVQVRSREGESPSVSFLGLLNGLVGTIDDGPKKGWGLITMVVEEDGSVSSFRRTKED